MRFLKHWLRMLGVVALCGAVPVGIVLLMLWHAWAGLAALMLSVVTIFAIASYEDGEYNGW